MLQLLLWYWVIPSIAQPPPGAANGQVSMQYLQAVACKTDFPEHTPIAKTRRCLQSAGTQNTTGCISNWVPFLIQ
jgi:hypothetical protein